MSKEKLYVTLALPGDDYTTGNDKLAQIGVNVNPIIAKQSDYNLYIGNMSIGTTNLPLACFYDRIIDFPTNRMGLILRFEASTPGTYPFNGNKLDGVLLNGLNKDPSTNNYDIVVAYVQFKSYDYSVPGFTSATSSTPNTPLEYFDVHAVNQFCQYINNTLTAVWTALNTKPTPTIDWALTYQAGVGFSLNGTYTNLNVFCNSYLANILDCLTFVKIQTPVAPQIPVVQNLGRDYQFVVFTNPEYDSASNFYTSIAVIITSQGIDTQPENLPVYGNIGSTQMPSMAILKYLSINNTGGSSASLSNAALVFEDDVLARPIKLISDSPLTYVRLKAYFLDSKYRLRELQISPNSGVSIRLIFEKK